MIVQLPASPASTPNIQPTEDKDREIERLKQALHRDETGLADSLAKVRETLSSYHWLTEGRGPYAWNDDRYKGEVLNMLEEIGGIVDKGLSESGKRSHAYCCGKHPTYEELQAELQQLKPTPSQVTPDSKEVSEENFLNKQNKNV